MERLVAGLANGEKWAFIESGIITAALIICFVVYGVIEIAKEKRKKTDRSN
jgi:hypothetical protein